MRASEEEKPEFAWSLSLSTLTLALVVPMGEKSSFDPEDLHKIFEFLDVIDPREMLD